MATIQKRKNKNGTHSYKVMIRIDDGLPPIYKTFPTHQEAKEWAIQEEALRRQGIYFPQKTKKQHTLSNLIERYIELILPTKPRSGEDIRRHLEWWKQKLGSYTLNHITPFLIASCRKELLEGITPRGTKRTSATTNRYLASLSAVLTYGVKECGWLSENPCFKVSKLSEPRGRDRVLSQEECVRLIEVCSKSSNRLLLPFVMIALTTGARKSEILDLTWDCIDFQNQLMHIKQSKNGHPRSVCLVGQALELVKQLYQERNPKNSQVFPSKKRFGSVDLKKAWTNALQKAQIEDYRIHDMRHFFASRASEKGATTLELAHAMGHLTLQMLMRYTHANANTSRRISHLVSAGLGEQIDA